MTLFPAGTGLSKQVSAHWFAVGAEDPEAVALFRRHYTCRRSRNCAVFRNEGQLLSSVLVREACDKNGAIKRRKGGRK